MRHLSLDQLQQGLQQIEPSPTQDGTVEMIVIRPRTDQRQTPTAAELSVELGVVGDDWSLSDEPNTEYQVTLMNSRVLGLLAGDRVRWPLAGDNLVVDLDLSQTNLPAGSRLTVGSAELEITPTPHTGCSKFASRFGADALRFVNLGEGPALRLRGANARVLKGGPVSIGDAIRRL